MKAPPYRIPNLVHPPMKFSCLFRSFPSSTPSGADEPSECVICFLDTPEEDLGYMCYLRAGPSFVNEISF